MKRGAFTVARQAGAAAGSTTVNPEVGRHGIPRGYQQPHYTEPQPPQQQPQQLYPSSRNQEQRGIPIHRLQQAASATSNSSSDNASKNRLARGTPPPLHEPYDRFSSSSISSEPPGIATAPPIPTIGFPSSPALPPPPPPAAFQSSARSSSLRSVPIRKVSGKPPPYCGIGLGFERGERGCIVTSLEPGSAAAAGGQIEVGDFFKFAAGKDVSSLRVEDIRKLLLGPVGTKVTIVVLKRRLNWAPLEVL